MSVDKPSPETPKTGPERRKAWLSLALFVVALPLAFLVGEAVAAALGADGHPSPQLTTMLAVLAVTVAVLCIPRACPSSR